MARQGWLPAGRMLRLILLSAALGGVVAVSLAEPARLYVAPAGNDAWSGRQAEGGGPAGPFRTLARAQKEVRTIVAAGAPEGGVLVLVRAGTYELDAPLALGPQDSGTERAPVVVCAYEGEKPVLVGARKVTGFAPYKGRILQCSLAGTPREKVAFTQLFFRGDRQVRARTPNLDPEDPHGGTWAHVAEVDGPGVREHFTTVANMIRGWTRVQGARVGIHPSYDWAWNLVPVKSVDQAAGTITLGQSVSYELRVGDRYYVENVFEELDAPGEWYLDRERAVLYFWPPADIATGEVLAPVTGTVVEMKGAGDITVRGFTIEACDGDAVRIEGCERCLVAQSVVRNCGGWGLRIAGGHHSGAAGNDVSATGAGGIMIDGGDRKTLARGDNYATNNYTHHIAAFAKTYNTGINVGGVGNLAAHNLIHDTYHAGMTLSGNENVMEYNLVHHTNLGSADTGGIYFCSRDWTQRGNIIRYNIFHHCGGFGKDNSWQPVSSGKVQFSYPHFTWGIYLDDPTTGTEVYGNILWSVPICGLHNHGGRDNRWENNIVVDCPAVNAGMLWDGWDCWPDIFKRLREAQRPDSPYLKLYPELGQYDEQHPAAMTGLKFVRNIFYYTQDGSRWLREKSTGGWDGGQLLYSYRTRVEDFPHNEFDYNTVWAPPGIDLKISLQRQPEAHQWLSWDQWRALGVDQHSVMADPLFVDPAHHDYRLKPESPALKLGFKPIPMEKIGPYADTLRASWPIVEAAGAARLGEFTTTRAFQLPGYEPVPAREFVPRSGIGRVFAKLAAKQPVTVAYYGGGIHSAGGWRGGVLKWLRERAPGVTVTEIDAGICDCSRGSGFSVYRFSHDVLRLKPDLVVVDFASDDFQTDTHAIWAAIEGIIRQARREAPGPELLLVYAFRAGFEDAYARELSPATISAYERLADRYGIASVNMGYRVARLAREGRLVIKATGEPAATAGKLVFSADGTRPSEAANQLYAQVITEALAKLAALPPATPRELPQPLYRGQLERAKLVAITPAMLGGAWEKIDAANVGGRSFAKHFDDVWLTRSPGATLSFSFTGTAVSLFDLMGPDTGRIKVTVDGKDMGTRQQVDPWAYYQRLAAMDLAGGLAEGVHTVKVELLAETPDRSVPIAEAKRVNRYAPRDFEGVALRLGWLRMVGELAP